MIKETSRNEESLFNYMCIEKAACRTCVFARGRSQLPALYSRFFSTSAGVMLRIRRIRSPLIRKYIKRMMP